MKRHIGLILTCVIFLSAVTIPYLAASSQSGTGYHFLGFLFNPIDGNSYLAKMQQGWQGQWRFTLPYTAEAGDGAYLFLFYILLGHISRLFHLPIIVTFHIARILSSVAMLAALWAWLKILFADRPCWAQRALTLIVLGSGLGWLAALWGGFTPDFWVAEAYPFLSAYANPHFPLGLAILFWVLTDIERTQDQLPWIVLFLLGCALSVILQFGLVILAVIWSALTLWRLLETHQLAWRRPLAFFSGGAFLLLYQFYAIRSDPILSGWDAQNLTPAPSVLNLLLGLLPAFLFALMGIRTAWTERNLPGRRQLILWLPLAVILIYFPFNLQRRFMLGLFVPIGALAVLGCAALPVKRSLARVLMTALTVLSLFTNLIVVWGGLSAARQHNPALFINANEADALEWLSQNASSGDIVLSSPEIGLLIPAHSNLRVLYGHPFETLNASLEEQDIYNFYAGQMNLEQAQSYLSEHHVAWVYWGPHEKALGSSAFLNTLSVAYLNPMVTIYQIVDTMP